MLVPFLITLQQILGLTFSFQPLTSFGKNHISCRSFPSGLYYRTKANIVEVETATKTTANDDVSQQLKSSVATVAHNSTSPNIKSKRKKPMIAKIRSLSEFQSFLDEDSERLVVVKFYASWCKSCQKLGVHYDKLARNYGDTIIDRKKVPGKVRFASFQHDKSEVTKELITETLKVHAIPTLQIYFGQYKLWELAGKTNTKELEKQLVELENLSADEKYDLAIERDDGILQDAIEDSLYDYPDFLDEEW